MFRGKIKHIHFVGIGGSGMSGIAEVLLNMGYRVTGSDLSENSSVQRLRTLGGENYLWTSHAKYRGSRCTGEINCHSRSQRRSGCGRTSPHSRHSTRREMLAELMRMKYGVAVAGTHGKTTTTSMLATCMYKANLDPTVVIGGQTKLHWARLLDLEKVPLWLQRPMNPMEASHEALCCHHHQHRSRTHGTLEKEEALIDGFRQFAQEVPFFGFVALCLDHPVVQSIIPSIRRKIITYGMSFQADVRAKTFPTTTFTQPLMSSIEIVISDPSPWICLENTTSPMPLHAALYAWA